LNDFYLYLKNNYNNNNNNNNNYNININNHYTYQAKTIEIDEVLSLKDICIKKIACSLENSQILKNFGDLPLHLKEMIMHRIPIYDVQMTNEMLINLFLESDFNHLHLVHSVVTYPVLSTILKIRYIHKHHVLYPSTSDSNNESTSPIIELTSGTDNNEEEETSAPPDSWEDIYNSSDEENPQLYGNYN